MTEQITEHMKEFLTELAALMEKHGISIEATEEDCGYATMSGGIEVSQESIYEGYECRRQYSSVKLSTGRWEVTSSDVKELLK